MKQRLLSIAEWASKRKYLVAGLIILLSATTFSYLKFVSPTRIAFVNFMDFHYAQILEAADANSFVTLDRLSFREGAAPSLNGYSAIYVFGHGNEHLTDEQAHELKEAAGKGAYVYVYRGTTENDLTTLAGQDLEHIEAYLREGGNANLRALLNYTRRMFDHKTLFTEAIQAARVLPKDYLFHLTEEQYFDTYEAYHNYYQEQGHYDPDAPTVALVTSNIGPRTGANDHIDAMLRELEKRGINVYPVSGFSKRLEFLKEINPDLVVLLPHGRLASGKGDVAVEWLKEQNIPLLAPISVFGPYDEWLQSQQGMAGGMLSQSIVMPELDGGINPYVISAQFPDEHGLYLFKGIPNRIETFVDLAEKWLALRVKPNREKKIAIYYYKGPGLNAMVAGEIEVAPSLLTLLRRLKAQGYETGLLPKDENELLEIIQREGVILGSYAKGAFQKYLEEGQPELIEVETYLEWCKKNLAPEMLEAMEKNYGPAPGEVMRVDKDGKSHLAVARVRFGNIVLLPQPPSAYGDDVSKLAHGAKKSPPHPYVASYLWVKNGFKADAIMHFGTHGNFEFTPWKQVALSEYDWPDALVGGLPHVYVYVISNPGEALIAKRRSYAVITSHLTAPFTESELNDAMAALHRKIHAYATAENETVKNQYEQSIRKSIIELELDRDLQLADFDKTGLTTETLDKLKNYLHLLDREKITLGLHTLGKRYEEEHIHATVRAMAIDPLSYSLAKLDVFKGRITEEQFEDRHYFHRVYRRKAFKVIDSILLKGSAPDRFLEREDLRKLEGSGQEHGQTNGVTPVAYVAPADKTNSEFPSKDKDEKAYVDVVRTYKNTLFAIKDYYDAIDYSPQAELGAVTNALSGGYVPPSSGGDAVRNPSAVPTGRNIYGIDPEKTPTGESWAVGVKLGDALLAAKLGQDGTYPKKVAFTLWGGEFIRGQGVTLAEILYLLGVEPVRNSRGTVHDVRLIPMAKLQRPRIDVVVQTSGQFRDLATSRIHLINKAVTLAAEANDGDGNENYVQEGTAKAEAKMKDNGLSPLDARLFANARVFGGVGGNYGAAIMDLVESGDKWEDEKEVAEQYLQTMGALYIEDHWGRFEPGVFEAALQNTDTVVQPRSSNTWGPLSLDHVYEFMGGLSAVVRQVTGNDPDAFFNDLRNAHDPSVQGAKEAIWVETRSTLFNPQYIQELQKGGATSAEVFAETFRNTYGWNVMKPAEIDAELWEGLYDVYVKDKHNLDLVEFFKEKNPYALQEMTAVMLETVRKGYWPADQETIKAIANLHATLVRDFKAGCSVFVCDNAKLRELIGNNLEATLKQAYSRQIDLARTGDVTETKEGMKLEKETITLENVKELVKENMAAVTTMLTIVILFSGAVILGVVKRRTR